MNANLSKEEKEVCNRIKQIRKQIGMKQYQFANEIGISPGTLSEIESCKSAPKLSTIISVCRIFSEMGYSIEYLLTGKKSENATSDNQISMQLKQTDETAETNRIGIKKYLTYDEDIALGYFRKLPFREQLIEIGELKIKARLADEAVKEGEADSSNFEREAIEETSATANIKVG